MLWVSSLLHPVAAAESTPAREPAKVNRSSLCQITEQAWGMWEKGREEGSSPFIHRFRCCSICSRSLNFWI